MGASDDRASNRTGTLSGIDRFLADRDAHAHLAGQRIGLLTNHACTTAGGIPVALAVRRALTDVRGTSLRLFTPEHGMWPVARAGAPVDHATDPLTGLSVHSLYGGDTDNPDAFEAGIDALVIDLRDVGVRCFTYAATAAQAARAALAHDMRVVMCDRINPLGTGAAGPRPDAALRSFLAFFDAPFIHGMTLAELVQRHCAAASGAGSLDIYPADTDLHPPLGWVPPSPALSHPDAVAAYGGLVLLEATNISEGRGTSLSFRSVSAPGLDAERLADAINSWNTGFRGAPGFVFHTRRAAAGSALPGVVVWPRTNIQCRPLALGVHLLAWLRAHHPRFEWNRVSGGYAIDRLFGRRDLRLRIDAAVPAEEILAGWRRNRD